MKLKQDFLTFNIFESSNLMWVDLFNPKKTPLKYIISYFYRISESGKKYSTTTYYIRQKICLWCATCHNLDDYHKLSGSGPGAGGRSWAGSKLCPISPSLVTTYSKHSTVCLGQYFVTHIALSYNFKYEKLRIFVQVSTQFSSDL